MGLPKGTNHTNSTMTGTLTRKLAVQILDRHGFTPTQSSVQMNEIQDGTSFDAELGVRDWYTVDALREWLGY